MSGDIGMDNMGTYSRSAAYPGVPGDAVPYLETPLKQHWATPGDTGSRNCSPIVEEGMELYSTTPPRPNGCVVPYRGSSLRKERFLQDTRFAVREEDPSVYYASTPVRDEYVTYDSAPMRDDAAVQYTSTPMNKDEYVLAERPCSHLSERPCSHVAERPCSCYNAPLRCTGCYAELQEYTHMSNPEGEETDRLSGLTTLPGHTYENSRDLEEPDDVFLPPDSRPNTPDLLRETQGRSEEYLGMDGREDYRRESRALRGIVKHSRESVHEGKGKRAAPGLSPRCCCLLWTLVVLLVVISVGLAAIAGISIHRQVSRAAGGAANRANGVACRYPVVFSVPNFRAMLLDGQHQRLVVVTRDILGPIHVYSCDGYLQYSLGADLWEVAAGRQLDIAMDAHRGQYLIPGRDKLLSIHRTGSSTVLLPLAAGGGLAGVTHLAHEDLYAVGAPAACRVYLLSPSSGAIIGGFNHSAACHTRFISSYFDRRRNQSILILSGRKKIEAFTPGGQHVAGLAGEEHRLGTVLGVSADPSGLLLATDRCQPPHCTGAVLSHAGLVDSGTPWRVVANQSRLAGGAPWTVDHDPAAGILAVGTDRDQIHVFNYRYTPQGQ